MSVGEWEVELWLGNNGSAKVRTQLFNTQTFFKFKPFKADNKKGGNRLKQGMVSKQYPESGLRIYGFYNMDFGSAISLVYVLA